MPQGIGTKEEIVNDNRGGGRMPKMAARAGTGKTKQNKEKDCKFHKKGKGTASTSKKGDLRLRREKPYYK